MAKELLIVDTSDCTGCPAAIHDEIDGYSMCQAMGLKDIPDHFSKPDWCPLIPEPERSPVVLDDEYAEGWNACLDALEEQKNERLDRRGNA